MKYITTLLGLVFAASLVFAATGTLLTQPVFVGGVYVNNVSYYSPYPAEPSGFVDLWVRVSNPGTLQAGSSIVDVECNLPEKPPFKPTDGALRFVGTLNRGDQALLQYRLSVSADAAPGPNKLDLYCRSAGQDWRATELTIYVQVSDAVLAVSKVESTPATVEPGSYGKIALKMENEAKIGLKNVVVNFDLASSSAPLSPVGQSTLVSLPALAAGDSADAVLNFFVASDAVSKAYNIPVTLTYSDELNNKYNKSMLVSAIVYSAPVISASLAEQPVALPNAKASLSINVFNRGFSDIKLSSVALVGGELYTLLSPSEVYLGTINSDDFDSVDYELFIKDYSGVLELPLQISFVDSSNQRQTVDVKVPLRVYSAQEASSLGLLPGGGITMWIVALIVIVLAYFGYKRFFKKKRAEK
ncbi:hypothetical protein AUJ14_00175 [Candidatus Micrarchaeota archaeon CG1_02_55_22]|nr:MAG: hypothetical protein AUJ14_00175 [Candidatus Micrarchaeota archaeon CG1_02_55_22]